jgi:SAM-dependent MidA family methyltransferase
MTNSNFIKDEIKKLGLIPFDHFMDIALYSENGYYMVTEPFAKSGDYYTSPRLHPLFGFMMAVQLNTMWKIIGKPSPFIIVEQGGGDDVLASDICKSLHLINPVLYSQLKYYILDNHYIHTSDPIIKSVLDSSFLKNMEVSVLLSNELIDAFPVKLFEINNMNVSEVFVGIKNGDLFQELILSPDNSLLNLLSSQEMSMLEGYRGPYNNRIQPWIETVSQYIDSGFVITIDYGYERNEYYSMEKSHKLLQTYYKHVDGNNPLQRVGRQDITAHVNFSEIVESGNCVGFDKVYYGTQKRWIESLGFNQVLKHSTNEHNNRMIAIIEGLSSINSFGNFKVLIQSKNIFCENKRLFCFDDQVVNVKLPDITDRHITYKI